MSLVSVRNISKSFSGVQALHDVSLDIGRGEVRCLAGENGSGKSTLIKIIAGAHPPDAGEIVIGERRYKSLRPRDAIREGVQIIYQDFSLFPNLTAAENIAFNQELASGRRFMNWRRVRNLAEEAVAKVGVDLDLDAPVETLPVADKQLIAISRALLADAKLIIMDEPTTALTEREVRSLLQIIGKLQADGVSVLFVSHKLNEVFEVSQKIAVLRNGEKVADGDASEFTYESLAYHMTGRKLSAAHGVAGGGERGRSLLKVSNLGAGEAFSGVSFELHRGEVLGVAGLLGSGRTALAKALFGLLPIEAGGLELEGRRVTIRSPQDALRAGIGYVPEDRLTEGLFLEQSIGRNIVVSKVDALSRAGFVDGRALRKETARWVDDLNIITPSPAEPVQSLSGGNQQRVVLARWLATKPKILILNGPTVGVDIGSKADIHEIIADLAGGGMGVIIVSDDIPELLGNCHRILIMKAGRVTEALARGEVTDDSLAQKLSGEALKGEGDPKNREARVRV